MKTLVLLAVLVGICVSTPNAWAVDETEKAALVCTGDERFVMNYPGKNGILLEQGPGKKVCMTVGELLEFTRTKNVVELLLWLGKTRNKGITVYPYWAVDATAVLLVKEAK